MHLLELLYRINWCYILFEVSHELMKVMRNLVRLGRRSEDKKGIISQKTGILILLKILYSQ